MTDYSHNLIRQYTHWGVYVHDNQSYLGRCVVWCDRTDAVDLTQATTAEREELFVILEDLKKAAETLFKMDWPNYAFLGNETPHLHGHFIPRYAAERTFMGMTFTDVHYGRNYQTDHAHTTPDEVREGVRDAYRKVLGV